MEEKGNRRKAEENNLTVSVEGFLEEDRRVYKEDQEVVRDGNGRKEKSGRGGWIIKTRGSGART